MAVDQQHYFNSGTYLHEPEYLKYSKKCRFSSQYKVEEEEFARWNEVVPYQLLTEKEFQGMLRLYLDFVEAESTRLLEIGFDKQSELLRSYASCCDSYHQS